MTCSVLLSTINRRIGHRHVELHHEHQPAVLIALPSAHEYPFVLTTLFPKRQRCSTRLADALALLVAGNSKVSLQLAPLVHQATSNGTFLRHQLGSIGSTQVFRLPW